MLAHGTVARRVETLRRVTDLFLGAVEYNEEQIEVFDDVFTCVVEDIESNAKELLARAPFAERAPLKAAPEAQDVAEAIAWLIEGARRVTGEILYVDGGMHIASPR